MRIGKTNSHRFCDFVICNQNYFLHASQHDFQRIRIR